MEECRNNFTVLWPKSPIISPESCFEPGFYNRRLMPYESTYIRRFKNRDSSRLYGITGKIRLKRFHIENDPQKGGTIPGRSRHKPPLPDPGLHSLIRIISSSSSSRKPPCPSRSPQEHRAPRRQDRPEETASRGHGLHSLLQRHRGQHRRPLANRLNVDAILTAVKTRFSFNSPNHASYHAIQDVMWTSLCEVA